MADLFSHLAGGVEPERSPIPDRDWDNLLLLDACRYDLFEECNILPGELEPYYSIASSTSEYVVKTFQGKTFPEIVCVTSTPKYYNPNVEDSFHDIVHVWKDDWEEEHRLVLPEVMNERVFEACEEYPNKRILAHYIPPHQPFIGPTGKQMPHQVQFSGDVIKMDMEQPNVWESIRTGVYEWERVWQAYKENLEGALPAIADVMDELQGKTVVTSDHGNVFGRVREFGVIGHPGKRHVKPLIQVPWLVYQNGDRRTITAGEAGRRSSDVDEQTVEERLSDLGYVD